MHSERRTPKTLSSVSSLAERAGLSAHFVRLYLRRGLMRASRRSSAGYQLFGDDDAERLRFIRVAQCLGFTLAGIGEIIRHGRRRESPCPLVACGPIHAALPAAMSPAMREIRAPLKRE